jgi:dihydrodipicolinate synthase/N-acetylneuraminate lyase
MGSTSGGASDRGTRFATEIFQKNSFATRSNPIMPQFPPPPSWVQHALQSGIAIPAHPLALTQARKLDERRQRALTRYYHAAGAQGIAAGVHTTQFEIRNPEHGLFQPVLELAVETLAACDLATDRQTVRIAGICGSTSRALEEAVCARNLGYHAGLLSLAALRDSTEAELISHCCEVAEVLPLFGFYLQTAVGGRPLSFGFWRQFAEIPNVVAIKVAPFNRYHTWDVIRAVAESGRSAQIALYTGNDDNIVLDLLGEYEVATVDGPVKVGFAGGLLGHWACWTQRAVELLKSCQSARKQGRLSFEWLRLAAQITDANAAFFDAANAFAGCIPGIHEVLRRQGLLDNTCCLNPAETLSPGQLQEIDRVYRSYPHLNDDDFVRENLGHWLS